MTELRFERRDGGRAGVATHGVRFHLDGEHRRVATRRRAARYANAAGHVDHNRPDEEVRHGPA